LKVIVLTSSRADYSNYLPLLKKLKADPFFQLRIIAFGTHVSADYGNTIDQLYADGFEVAYSIDTLLPDNGPEGISRSMGITIEKFAHVWAKEQKELDLVICLGDRYEMFAAVSSIVPFTIPVAHLYGGDTTLGAIDDMFRHAITLMSKYHFTSLQSSADRVAQLTGNADRVYAVGSLSLDNLHEIKLLSKEAFQQQFHIPLANPLLVTFHPETVNYKHNETYIHELLAALETVEQQIIITMPNADTMGQIIREHLLAFAAGKKNVFVVESFGTIGYFSCIRHCHFIIGNSSSGIIEAASFGKYVINLGNRQQGRPAGKNVLHCKIEKNEIIRNMKAIDTFPRLSTFNIYGDGKTADRIISILKTIPPKNVTAHD
jgi:GDP/UDP-N,N'-diacetylbacillosamine 2-epimerase (hydrolysing)